MFGNNLKNCCLNHAVGVWRDNFRKKIEQQLLEIVNRNIRDERKQEQQKRKDGQKKN